MLFTLLNVFSTKISGFDANQWGIWALNKAIDSVPYLTQQTINGILITSPFIGYTVYGTLVFTGGLKLAEYGYNYKYFLNNTVESLPVVSQVAWGFHKVRNVFTKDAIEPSQQEYYPLFNHVMSKLNLDKISITYGSNSNITETSTQTTIPEPEPVQPQVIFRNNNVYIDRYRFNDVYRYRDKTVYRDRKIIECRDTYIPLIEYRDRENLMVLDKNLRDLKLFLQEDALAKQGIVSGLSNLIEEELKKLEIFNNFHNNVSGESWYTRHTLPATMKFKTIELLNYYGADRCYNSVLDEYITTSHAFTIKYQGQSSEIFLLGEFVQTQFPILYNFFIDLASINREAFINIKYSRGWYSKIEPSLCLFNNSEPVISFMVDFIAKKKVTTQIPYELQMDQLQLKINQNLVVKETSEMGTQTYDSTDEFMAKTTSKFVPDHPALNLSVDMSQFMQRASQSTKKRQEIYFAKVKKLQAKQIENAKINKAKVLGELLVKHGWRQNEVVPVSTDFISPLAVGGSVLITGAASTLTQIPLEDAWNVIFNSQACLPLLTDTHFVSAVTNAFPSVTIPVQETARSLEAAHNIVDTIVTDSTASSISTITEGNLSVVTSKATSSLTNIVPSFRSVLYCAGAGLAFYGVYKLGVHFTATEAKEFATAAATEDFSEYFKVR